jgi:uncharacterized phage-associated protein
MRTKTELLGSFANQWYRSLPAQKCGQRENDLTGHNVLSVANEFIGLAAQNDKFVTPMHLEKLCYMAHGFTLALLDRPLTRNIIEAWDYGPVYPDLYDSLKMYGSGTVTGLIWQNNWASDARVRGKIA